MPGGRGGRRSAGLAWLALLLAACAVAPQGVPVPQAPDTPRAASGLDAAANAPMPAPRTAESPPSAPALADQAAQTALAVQAALGAQARRTAPEPPEPDDDEAADALLLDEGLASWYGPGLNGRRTASGERFDRLDFTAAHRTLPFGTRVCVRSLADGKAVLVRINDRGPFSGNGERVVDLSQAAARELGMTGLGIKAVQLWQVDEDGSGCVPALGAAPAPPAARR